MSFLKGWVVLFNLTFRFNVKKYQNAKKRGQKFVNFCCAYYCLFPRMFKDVPNNFRFKCCNYHFYVGNMFLLIQQFVSKLWENNESLLIECTFSFKVYFSFKFNIVLFKNLFLQVYISHSLFFHSNSPTLFASQIVQFHSFQKILY